LLGRLRIIPYAAQVYEFTVEAFHSLYQPDARHMRLSCIDFIIHGALLANYQWIVGNAAHGCFYDSSPLAIEQ
jgi:hypothetical protein